MPRDSKKKKCIGKKSTVGKPCPKHIEGVSPAHNIRVSYPFPIHGQDHSAEKKKRQLSDPKKKMYSKEW